MFKEGDVVICGSGQAGTVIQVGKTSITVMLRNTEMWIGSPFQCRFPQSDEDLASCPLEVPHFHVPEKRKMNREEYD